MSVFNALNRCIDENDFNGFKKLLEENPSCVYEKKEHHDQETLLHLAILANNVKITELLFKYGADLYTETLVSKMTGLHYAAFTECTILQKCLQHVDARGVNIAKNHSLTPLDHAIMCKKTHSIDMLLNAGARVSLVLSIAHYDKSFKHLLSKRHRTQSSAMVVLGILRFRRKPVVCRDMRNEIGKRIWETRMDEKWATKEGLRDSSLESSKKKPKRKANNR